MDILPHLVDFLQVNEAMILTETRLYRFFWGICEMCFAASTNFGGIATARFFLGFCEGAVSPGFVVITSNWYKRQEHAIRIA